MLKRAENGRTQAYIKSIFKNGGKKCVRASPRNKRKIINGKTVWKETAQIEQTTRGKISEDQADFTACTDISTGKEKKSRSYIWCSLIQHLIHNSRKQCMYWKYRKH